MDSLDFYIFYCNSDITRPLLLQRFHWWQGPLELYHFAFCPRHIYSYLWKSPRDTPPMGHSPPVLRPTCSSPAVSLSWYPAREVHVMALPEEGCHPAQHTQSPSLENKQCPKEIQPTEIQFCLPTPATWQFLVCPLIFSFHRKGRITQNTSKILLWERAYPSCTHFWLVYVFPFSFLNTYMQNMCQLLEATYALSVIMRSLIHIWLLIDNNY